MNTVRATEAEAAAIERAREALAAENPRSWIWEDDGDELAGQYVADDEATTREGDQVPIRVLKVNGEHRSLWLFESPRLLREKWEEASPSFGDFVIARRYPKRRTQDGERFYWPFAVAKVPAEPGGDAKPSGGGNRVDNAGIHEPL